MLGFGQEGLDALQETLPDGWTILDDVSLETPKGHVIEWDGISPDGEESILRKMGMI